ncbi:spermatogenesis-associated protein 31E1-like [Grammomys surdaster]|uniref:spermatogenesis-associated protein 31E1-like n=1 Tax=Grammomys surdaster TaxID=491861 RepID=UPI0010A00BFC|nr:spermatogenesis-associated protein 31E1-like [Grammomys surdaster]
MGCEEGAQRHQEENCCWKSSAKHPLLDSSPRPFWNSKEILHQLTLSQLFSHLRVLENLIQHKFNQLLWGISSVFSESVVATAWASRKPSSGRHKTVRFSDACVPVQALPMAKGPPQPSQDPPLPHQLVTPSLVGMTGIQELEDLPSSTPSQTPSLVKSRAYGKACPTTERGIQVSLPSENEPWKDRLNWKDNIGSNVQKHQAATSQPTDNLSRSTLPIKAIRSASTLPEHCQMLQHHEETLNADKATTVGEQQGIPVRLLPSKELTQLQGHFPANSDHYCKSRPQLSQPAQPSSLNSKSFKWSQMMGSVPTGVPLKEAIAKRDIPNTIKKGLGVGVKHLPCTSSSSPGKGLEPRNPAVRTDKLSSINTTKDLSFFDPKTQMKLEPNIMQLPMKGKRKLPCDSKAEYYSKAAMILEKLHHQDPGGTRVATVSTARLRNSLFEHSPPEVQETQRTPPPAASHGPSKAHPDPQQRYLSAQPHATCSQAKLQQSKTLQGTGKACLLPNTSPGTARHAPWRKSEGVASGHPCCSATRVGPDKSIPPSVVKQTNTLKVKEEPPQAWRVSLGSSEIPNDQTIKTVFESVEIIRSRGHFQTPILQHPGDLALKTKVYNKVNLKSSKPVNHHPHGPSTVHPATVSLSSWHSLLSFQNPKTSQGHGFMKSDQSVETQEFRVHKDKITAKNDNTFHSHEERPSILKSGGISHGESLGKVRPSIPSSTQLKGTVKTESQSFLYKQGKREAPPKSSLKNIMRDAAQYGNLSTNCKREGDSLKNESPTLATEQTQEVIERENIYGTVDELQSFINVLVQNLVDYVGASKEQECKVESLTFQLLGSSEGLYDPNLSRPVSRISCGHASPERHKHSPRYRKIEHKQQPGVDHKAFDPHQSPKKGMDSGCLMSPKESHPVKYRGTGGQKQSAIVAQGASDPDEIRTKYGKEFFPHRSPEMHNHSFRETRDKLQRDCDQHPYSVNRVGFEQLPTSKGNNHPHRSRTKELEARSSHMLLPREPLIPGRPYQQKLPSSPS